MNLNQSALRSCQPLLDEPARYRVSAICQEGGAQIVDCGVHTAGGLEAGRILAEVCVAGLGRVAIVPGRAELVSLQSVTIATDHPLLACMGSQYAGWQIAGEKDFFAMGSGPMRAARGREALYEHLVPGEKATRVIGVLESGKLPPADVCEHIAEECGVEAEQLLLLVAPTRSLAGAVQVVARSVETALHKLHTLGFPCERVQSGFGAAPLPPTTKNDMDGIGRTNDAVLYGGEVTLWVRGDDQAIQDIGPRVPSAASKDYGQPFGDVFKNYGYDFYKVDPLLFSPAVVTFVNQDTGRAFRFGQVNPGVLKKSFAIQ